VAIVTLARQLCSVAWRANLSAKLTFPPMRFKYAHVFVSLWQMVLENEGLEYVCVLGWSVNANVETSCWYMYLKKTRWFGDVLALDGCQASFSYSIRT